MSKEANKPLDDEALTNVSGGADGSSETNGYIGDGYVIEIINPPTLESNCKVKGFNGVIYTGRWEGSSKPQLAKKVKIFYYPVVNPSSIDACYFIPF